MTIVEMLEKNLRLFPKKTAIIYRESRISYKEFYEKSNTLANFLVSNGLTKGEKVGLLLKKTPEARNRPSQSVPLRRLCLPVP